MNDKEREVMNAANGAIEAATEHIKEQRNKVKLLRLRTYCLTCVLCVLVVCASAVGCFAIYSQHQTIVEQQYALNMQYASLMEYVAGADVTTTYHADSGENGTAILGDGNMIAGGDVNGNR